MKTLSKSVPIMFTFDLIILGLSTAFWYGFFQLPQKLFYKEDDVAFFKEAYPSLKKRIIMYLKIIDKTYNMDLAATEIYIKNLKKQYPTLRFKNTTRALCSAILCFI